MTKQNLISRLGAGLLIATTGLVGLTGCATTPKNNIPKYVQQPKVEYNQYPAQAPAKSPKVKKDESDNGLGKAVLGGVLGSGIVGTFLPSGMNSTARAATEAVTRGAGNGILAHSTRAQTNVNVNADANGNGYNLSGQSQVSYAPAQQTIDERLLPEDNPAALSRELNVKRVSGPSADDHYGGIYSIVTSRETSDLNGDGTLQMQEFIERTRNFKLGQHVNVNVCVKGCSRSPFIPSQSKYDLTCEISDQAGNLVGRRVHSGRMDGYDKGEVLTFPASDLMPGVYTVICKYKNSNDRQRKHPSEKKTIFQVLEN